jgi:hypothetical protein
MDSVLGDALRQEPASLDPVLRELELKSTAGIFPLEMAASQKKVCLEARISRTAT